nr:IS66 family transposase zinc-finger binding domain-containing protein [Psychromonas hadalis]
MSGIINTMENTNNQLPTDVKTLQDLRLKEQSLLIEKEAEINTLLEQLRLSRAQRFSSSSEKQNPQQSELFDEVEQIIVSETDDEPVGESGKNDKTTPSTAKKRGRSTLPAHLPRVDVVYDLDDADKFCPHDGQPLHKIGEEISEQLEIIPATIEVIRSIRFKYTCRCCEQGIHSASMPKQAFPKSNATEGTLAYIAVSKYQDALPLYHL